MIHHGPTEVLSWVNKEKTMHTHWSKAFRTNGPPRDRHTDTTEPGLACDMGPSTSGGRGTMEPAQEVTHLSEAFQVHPAATLHDASHADVEEGLDEWVVGMGGSLVS